MRTNSYGINHFHPAKQRFLKPLIMQFFTEQFPKYFGPIIREKLADELIKLLHRACPRTELLRPGQLIWVALHKDTRGDSPHRKLVPVVLSLITEEDVDSLEKGTPHSVVTANAIARMITQAYQQGGILSMRDLALITMRHSSSVSAIRRQYEEAHQCVLPHTGVLHDMGSCISHKRMILKKILIEKKDPATAANECGHSQQAVDVYLKHYYRVETAYEHQPDPEYIHRVTGIPTHVVIEYIDILKMNKEST